MSHIQRATSLVHGQKGKSGTCTNGQNAKRAIVDFAIAWMEQHRDQRG